MSNETTLCIAASYWKDALIDIEFSQSTIWRIVSWQKLSESVIIDSTRALVTGSVLARPCWA
jgi:hypothetical protein